jgi:hypothetical protein
MSSSATAFETLEQRRLFAGLPAMFIGDLTLTEGNAGTKNAEVVVSLSHPRPKPTVTVKFATQNGSAVAGSDYTATSGMLSFPPGVDSKTILVPVAGDTTDDQAVPDGLAAIRSHGTSAQHFGRRAAEVGLRASIVHALTSPAEIQLKPMLIER